MKVRFITAWRSVTPCPILTCLFSPTTFFSEVRFAGKSLHDLEFGLSHCGIKEASKPDWIGADVSVVLSTANTPSAA